MLIEKIINRLKKYKVFSDMLTPETFSQMRRYVITGFSGFAIEYFLFNIFNELIFVKFPPGGYTPAKTIAEKFINDSFERTTYRYLLANAIAYVVAFWYNFLLNRFWSFKSKVNIFKQLKQYSALFIFNLIIASVLLYLLSDKIGIMPKISKILVMGMLVCWNFVLYKKVIYK
ncbi:MAG: GtrA family protein [Hungateiclostridium saccincola]|nr:GtrA family protein [Acetivibrio saccincola]